MGQPQQRTVKRLFAVSGNVCAFPKCVTRLVEETSGKVTGQICHIKARSNGGPRYDGNQSEEERHGFDNLLLMCPIHHDVVDADVKTYSVERLLQIKADHESAHSSRSTAVEGSDEIADRLLINASTANLTEGSIITSVNQSGGQTAHAITNISLQVVPPPLQEPSQDLQRFVIEQTAVFDSHKNKFVGRSWLFEKVETHLSSAQSGFVIVTGPPGVGKSAFLAAFARKHDCIAQFVVGTQGLHSRKLILQSLCAKLIIGYKLRPTRLPEHAGESGAFLLELLKEAAATIDNHPIVLVIDALNEAEMPLAGENPLGLPSELPNQVFILSSLQDRKATRLHAESLLELRIDPRGQDQEVDLNMFAERFIHDNQVAMQQHAPHLDRKNLLTKADGSFIALRGLLEELVTGKIGNQELPHGLVGYYELRLSIIEKERGGLAIRLLELLAVAKEPIRHDVLAAWVMDDPIQIRQLLNQMKTWEVVLDARWDGTYYALQRDDFAQFLAGRPSFQDAIDRVCDHNLKETNLSDYTLRRIPQHLEMRRRLSDLVDLIVSSRWRTACANHANGRVLSRKATRILVEQFTAIGKKENRLADIPNEVLAYLVAARWEVLDNPAVLTGHPPLVLLHAMGLLGMADLAHEYASGFLQPYQNAAKEVIKCGSGSRGLPINNNHLLSAIAEVGHRLVYGSLFGKQIFSHISQFSEPERSHNKLRNAASFLQTNSFSHDPLLTKLATNDPETYSTQTEYLIDQLVSIIDTLVAGVGFNALGHENHFDIFDLKRQQCLFIPELVAYGRIDKAVELYCYIRNEHSSVGYLSDAELLEISVKADISQIRQFLNQAYSGPALESCTLDVAHYLLASDRLDDAELLMRSLSSVRFQRGSRRSAHACTAAVLAAQFTCKNDHSRAIRWVETSLDLIHDIGNIENKSEKLTFGAALSTALDRHGQEQLAISIHSDVMQQLEEFSPGSINEVWTFVQQMCLSRNAKDASSLAQWLEKYADCLTFDVDDVGYVNDREKVYTLQLATFCNTFAENWRRVRKTLDILYNQGSKSHSAGFAFLAATRCGTQSRLAAEAKKAAVAARETVKFWFDDDNWGPKWRGDALVSLARLGCFEEAVYLLKQEPVTLCSLTAMYQVAVDQLEFLNNQHALPFAAEVLSHLASEQSAHVWRGDKISYIGGLLRAISAVSNTKPYAHYFWHAYENNDLVSSPRDVVETVGILAAQGDKQAINLIARAYRSGSLFRHALSLASGLCRNTKTANVDYLVALADMLFPRATLLK